MKSLKLLLTGCLALLLAGSLTAQQQKFPIRLTGAGTGAALPDRFDTIYVNQDFKKNLFILSDINRKDSFFHLPPLPSGRYLLLFSTASFKITPLLIVVCGECRDMYSFNYRIASDSSFSDIYELVEIGPQYAGGYDGLAHDFQHSLSKKETKALRTLSGFTVNFFVTTNGKLSDIRILPGDLPTDKQQLIMKGIRSLNKWKPAVRNGAIADSDFSLTMPELMGE